MNFLNNIINKFSKHNEHIAHETINGITYDISAWFNPEK